MGNNIFEQEKGDRNYRLSSGDVKLQSNTVNTLKKWNDLYPTILYDCKYLKRIAVDVFGILCLKMSSVFGTRARNSTAQHERLDVTKLSFVEGSFVISYK